MSLRTNMAGIAVFCLILGTNLFVPDSARAGRYHIQTSGTRTSGPSEAGDWAAENCYPTLEEASVSASEGDSILFYSETHYLNSSVSMPGFLGNMNLDTSWSSVYLILSPEAQMVIHEERDLFVGRGLTITSDGDESHLAAFMIEGGLNSDSHFLIESCYFNQNQGSDANSGGGSCISAQGDGNGALLEISNSIFAGNTNRGRGGAVFISDGYDVEIDNSVFVNNDSEFGAVLNEGRGGAIAVVSPNSQSRLFISNTRFIGNRAWGPGGTIYIDDGSLSFVDSDLIDSESAVDLVTEWAAGAGIFMRRTESHLDTVFLTVENCVFDGSIAHLDTNPLAGDGGAILVKGLDDRYVDVNVTDCLFQNNFNAQGAGLYMGRFATGNVTRCKFLNNTALFQGGASFKGGAFEANLGETAVYTYCEFTGNKAGLDLNGNQALDWGRGGAFSTRFNPRGDFYNCTFYNNEAHGTWREGDAIMLPNEGGTFYSDGQRCAFVNSVFYGEGGNSLQVVSRTGAIRSVSNCAFEYGEVQTGGIAEEGTVHLTGNPFEGLENLMPGANSPLLDVALEMGQTVDIMGNPVPFGAGPDIGAYERNGLVAVPDNNLVMNMLTVSPNPFNPQTVLKYEVSVPGPVLLEIYDVAGYKIKTMVQEHQLIGSHSILWQGKNEQGQAMASGVYFARLRVGGNNTISKLTLVR